MFRIGNFDFKLIIGAFIIIFFLPFSYVSLSLFPPPAVTVHDLTNLFSGAFVSPKR